MSKYSINTIIKSVLVSALAIMCLVLVACGTGNGGSRNWPVEALSADEFSFYADNANVFADDVQDSGAKFLYVQLACADDSALSEEETALANDNADGICAMIANDHHDVWDARENATDIVEAIAEKLELAEEARILVIGDGAGESQVYEELVKSYGNVDYRNSIGINDEGYDEMYSVATTAGFDAVIVANDVAAFHAQSFPFSA